MTVECIANYPSHTGENPLWHPEEKRVYWVDIPPGKLYRHTPDTGASECVLDLGRAIGGFTLQEDGALLLFMELGEIALWREGQPLQTIVESIPAELESRFNDVIARPDGGVFCGTMPSVAGPGRLYHLTPSGELTVSVEGVKCSNGMGYTQDLKTFFHTDSGERRIWRYDHDPDSGAISNRRVFFELPEGSGAPDGMTLDSEGCVWAAVWGGGCVIRLDPEGREMERHTVPVPKASSVTFGGPDYATLYITTAGGNERDRDGLLAGSLFQMAPGVKGLPEYRSRVWAGKP